MEEMKPGRRGVSLRKLMEYHLCPHSLDLWQKEPLQETFLRCAGKFRSVTKTYLREGYQAAELQVADFIRNGGSKATEPLRQRLRGWLAHFHRAVDRDRSTFAGSGRQLRAPIGPYELRLDVWHVRRLSAHTNEAWIFHDSVEEHLGPRLARVENRLTKYILALAAPDVSHVIFYRYQSGILHRESVPTEAADVKYVPQAHHLINDYVQLNDLKKRPGPHCMACFHFTRRTCTGSP